MARTVNDQLFNPVHRFVTAAMNDEPAAECDAELLRLLEESDEACDLYLECVQMSVILPSVLAAEPDEEAVSCGELFADSPKHSFLLPLPGFLDTAVGGPASYLSSGWPLAYLVATIILAVGLVVGSMTHVSCPGETTAVSPLVAGGGATTAPKAVSVGFITGMVDCVWEGSGFRGQDSGASSRQSGVINQRFSLHLGDRLALRSGLVEISYDRGAKVILQGPARYEVESSNGGFLSIGRLTGHVITANAKGFCIRTPTAVVTDLGTEFGVEVAAEGHTISHVFRGSVEVRTIGSAGGATPAVRILRASESVQVAASASLPRSAGEIRAVQVDPERFVRQLSHGLPIGNKALPMQVVAWFRLGEDDPGAVVGAPVASATINHCGHYPLTPRTRPTYSDNVAPMGSSLSLSFSGAKNECVVNSHVPYLMTEEFVLEAWVRIRKIEKYFQFIAYSGEPNRNGYGLLVGDGRWQFLLGRVRMVDSGVPCELGEWTHLALVCEGNKAQLWINGQPAGRPFVGQPHLPDTSFSIGCDHVNNPAMAFVGEIDEVRLSTLSGRFRPEMLLFRSSSPKGEKGGTGK